MAKLIVVILLLNFSPQFSWGEETCAGFFANEVNSNSKSVNSTREIIPQRTLIRTLGTKLFGGLTKQNDPKQDVPTSLSNTRVDDLKPSPPKNIALLGEKKTQQEWETIFSKKDAEILIKLWNEVELATTSEQKYTAFMALHKQIEGIRHTYIRAQEDTLEALQNQVFLNHLPYKHERDRFHEAVKNKSIFEEEYINTERAKSKKNHQIIVQLWDQYLKDKMTYAERFPYLSILEIQYKVLILAQVEARWAFVDHRNVFLKDVGNALYGVGRTLLSSYGVKTQRIELTDQGKSQVIQILPDEQTAIGKMVAEILKDSGIPNLKIIFDPPFLKNAGNAYALFYYPDMIFIPADFLLSKNKYGPTMRHELFHAHLFDRMQKGEDHLFNGIISARAWNNGRWISLHNIFNEQFSYLSHVEVKKIPGLFSESENSYRIDEVLAHALGVLNALESYIQGVITPRRLIEYVSGFETYSLSGQEVFKEMKVAIDKLLSQRPFRIEEESPKFGVESSSIFNNSKYFAKYFRLDSGSRPVHIGVHPVRSDFGMDGLQVTFVMPEFSYDFITFDKSLLTNNLDNQVMAMIFGRTADRILILDNKTNQAHQISNKIETFFKEKGFYSGQGRIPFSKLSQEDQRVVLVLQEELNAFVNENVRNPVVPTTP